MSLLLIGLAIAALACGRAEAPPESIAAPVVLAEVQTYTLEDRIEASGELIAPNEARIAAEVPGRITQILFDEGDAVGAGQTVIEIDPERRQLDLADTSARLTEARAALRDSQREAGRVRLLHGKNVASQQQLDQAETALALARSRVEAAEAHLGVAERALRDASVAAPFEGWVALRRVSVGEFVQVGQELFDLVALDPIEVEFHVAETDSARVSEGNPVEVRVAPYPDEVFRARVTVISPVIDPRTRTLRVKAVLPNADGRLRPGLFARIDLGIDRREGVAMVPEEAILYRMDGSVVFRVGPDLRAERRIVETGVHVDGRVEVVHGVSAGDRVVRRGHTELIDGTLVAARNPDGTAAVAGGPADDEDGG